MTMPPGTWPGVRMRQAAFALAAFAMAPLTSLCAADVALLPRVQAIRLAGGDLPAPSALADALLTEPGSPYSDLNANPSFANSVAWIDLLDGLPGLPGEAWALRGLALELGLTRARPDQDVLVRSGYRDPFVAASATKAGIDPDIFWHMLDLGGYRHSARTAAYAVALQELRRQIATVPVERHTANGIDPSVLARVMQARHWGDIAPYDLDYLGTLVQAMLHSSPVPSRASDGTPLPPPAYRVARLAAAWRDTEGYFTQPPCNRDATPRPSARSGGMPCFVAATDRGVHAWYIGELRRQARLPPPDARKPGISRLLEAVALLMPLLDIAALAEVVEAAVTDDLAFDGMAEIEQAEAAEERAATITCHLGD